MHHAWPQAERISTMNMFSIARLLFYMVFGFGLPGAALYLGIFLPYSR